MSSFNTLQDSDTLFFCWLKSFTICPSEYCRFFLLALIITLTLTSSCACLPSEPDGQTDDNGGKSASGAGGGEGGDQQTVSGYARPAPLGLPLQSAGGTAQPAGTSEWFGFDRVPPGAGTLRLLHTVFFNYYY